MKFIVLAAVFSIALVFAAAAPAEESFQQTVSKREEEALKQCNVTYPAAENTRVKLGLMVIKGETVPKDFNTSDWCNLYCNLEKLGFFDAQGKMQVRKIFKFTLKSLPEISPNSHTLLVHLFQIYRSTKGMEDKCSKAFVAYHRFAEAVFVSSVAVDLNAQTDVREKIVESVVTGEEIPQEFQKYVEKYLKNVDLFVKQVAEQSAAPASAPAPAQVPSS
ncbi:uncharacterized protein LOC135835628 [Planococcus citri]|uniref:uncharacterized protein LOC135835628 n=1 Tax=Planococcus citri TaxID=170843 RepID=UPI0031F9B47A